MFASAVPIASDGLFSSGNAKPNFFHNESRPGNPTFRNRLKVGIFIEWIKAPESEYFPPWELSKFAGLHSSYSGPTIESLSR